ncbi:MAG: FUSC family protein [Geobacteraceae bacterium]|nr:FUSC family protein [Geobacteraceae bacterium]
MKSPAWSEIWFRLSAFARQILAMAGEKAAGLLFVFKMTLAVLLAMWVSMRFELGQPVTAMVTVYVIMQSQSGLVLTKSVYRVLGTVGGTLACLVLFALFPQERVLFLLGLSLWVGLCTAGATLNRNFRCYGFVLAGYTAAMIGLPLATQPTAFFSYAVNRFSEVMVGIFCAGLVSDLIFPQHLGDTIVVAVRARYVEFTGFVQALLHNRVEQHDLEQLHLRFISSVLSLESLRGAALLETTQTDRSNARLRRLNSDFMAASTTLHSFHQLLKRLQKAGSPAADALVTLSMPLAESLSKENESAGSAEDAHQVARRIAEFRASLSWRVETQRQALDTSPESLTALDFDTGIELLRRFVRELHDYTRAYATPPEELTPSSMDELRFASRTDLAVALLSGMRAMLAVLLVAAFWIATAWPYGSSAVMMVAIGCALFAPAADPARAIKWGLVGVSAAFPASFACKFIIMPSLDGFGLLCAALVPFLLVGPWLSLSPKTAMIGLGYSTMLCFMIAPGNTMQYDPVQMVNYGSALMLGLAGAAVMFATFAPAGSPWLKRRIPHMLRRQVLMACHAPLPGLGHRFESSTRDLLKKIAVVRDAHDRHTLDWMFSALEMGRAVIHLRQGAEAARESIEKCISSIERLFRQPSSHNRAAAISTVADAIDSMRIRKNGKNPGSLSHDGLRLVTTSLHCIRITLLDDDTVLSIACDGPTPTQGDALYAT